MTRLLRLDGRNVPARAAALARLATIPLLPLFEALSPMHGRADLWFADPVFAILVAYALASSVYAFAARGDVPLAPFAVADTVLLALITWGEGDPTSDVRFLLFVPVLVAVLKGPRLTLAIAALSVAAFVAGAVARPALGADTDAGVLAVQTLSLAWRAGVAVVIAVLLNRRAERIRALAESRRSLVTQALNAEARARRELSYVLHDELVQELLCAQQDLKVARRGRPEYVDRAEAALASAVARLRHEIFHLHPHVLETAGLEAALDAVAGDQARGDAARPVVTVARRPLRSGWLAATASSAASSPADSSWCGCSSKIRPRRRATASPIAASARSMYSGRPRRAVLRSCRAHRSSWTSSSCSR